MSSLFVNPENKGSNIADTVSAIQDEAWRQQGDEPSRSSNSGIFIVVPAYNEGPVIQEILFTLASNREIKEIGCQVVIVDDGSTDDTWKNVVMFISSSGSINEENRLENRLEVHLLHHVVNLGQGAALATGIQYALAEGAQMIVTFDADGQHLVEDIPSLVAPISAGLADVALGSRFLPTVTPKEEDSAQSSHEDGQSAFNIPWPRRMLLKMAILFTGLTEKIWLSDVHNGLRAFSAGAAGQIKITQNRMAHASEIIHEIARLNLRYVEVPVHVRYTEYSRKKGQRAFDALNVIVEMLEMLFTGEEK